MVFGVCGCGLGAECLGIRAFARTSPALCCQLRYCHDDDYSMCLLLFVKLAYGVRMHIEILGSGWRDKGVRFGKRFLS